jgi:predicted regulator of Ras-like GTPase activity (Roadblock/LC7/MglB family)
MAKRTAGRAGEEAYTSSTEILESILKVPGIDAVVIIGRDGFVVEAAGKTKNMELDDLGASLALGVNALEEMGSDLGVPELQDMYVDYGDAMITCQPLGDSLVGIVAPDSKTLGIIRNKVKKFLPELERFL